MSDETEFALPKIVDFGLSKMIGPKEKANEPFGTLGYTAPEVLQNEPYSYNCDVWSIGCIMYALLAGSLPFDHKEPKELIRMTINDAVKFEQPVWNSVSVKCKNLIAELL